MKNKKKPELGFTTNCRSCNIERSKNYQNKHMAERVEYDRNRRIQMPELYREKTRRYQNKNKIAYQEKVKSWQRNNPDKVKENNQYRKQNKTHNITEEQWLKCKEFFADESGNHSCAYCRIVEQESIKIYGQQLHKEHVSHEGSNGIDNCVPACKKCNSRKNTRDLLEWYNSDNKYLDNYSEDNLQRILNWLLRDYNTNKEK